MTHRPAIAALLALGLLNAGCAEPDVSSSEQNATDSPAAERLTYETVHVMEQTADGQTIDHGYLTRLHDGQTILLNTVFQDTRENAIAARDAMNDLSWELRNFSTGYDEQQEAYFHGLSFDSTSPDLSAYRVYQHDSGRTPTRYFIATSPNTERNASVEQAVELHRRMNNASYEYVDLTQRCGMETVQLNTPNAVVFYLHLQVSNRIFWSNLNYVTSAEAMADADLLREEGSAASNYRIDGLCLMEGWEASQGISAYQPCDEPETFFIHLEVSGIQYMSSSTGFDTELEAETAIEALSGHFSTAACH